MSVLKIREKILDIFLKVNINKEINDLYLKFSLETLEPALDDKMESFIFFLNYENTLFKLEQICIKQNKRKLLININKIKKKLNKNKIKSVIIYKNKDYKRSYKKIINSCIDTIQGISTKSIPNKEYDIIINHFKNKECTMIELKKLLNSNKKFLQYYNQIPYLYHRFNKNSINLSNSEENQIRFIFINLMRYIVKNEYKVNYYYFLFLIIKEKLDIKDKHLLLNSIPLPSIKIQKKYYNIWIEYWKQI